MSVAPVSPQQNAPAPPCCDRPAHHVASVVKQGMSSFWTGTRIRLRGIEPEDWA